MNNLVVTYYSDICPRFDEYRTIEIRYAVIPILGRSPGYKKMSFTCDDGTDCPHLDQWGRCPLMIDAPDEPD